VLAGVGWLMCAILLHSFHSVMDQITCWILAAACACALMAGKQYSRASTHVCFPERIPVPCRPEMMAFRVGVRSVSIFSVRTGT